MSQFHQGPHFPVSSSPILPLDALPTRSRRPSSVSLDPRLSFSTDLRDGRPGAPQPREPPLPGPARSAPADWVGEATPIDLDVPKFSAPHRPGSQASAGTASPYAPPSHPPHPNAPVGWQVAPSPLNLVPYKPFPENPAGNGTSFFYRSPTPSARQRTNQACEKCRDRKTKCSGGRPTCVRCQSRGLICEYASETRVRGPSKGRKRTTPSLDGPAALAARRRTTSHQPPVPRGSTDHSMWESQPAAAKAPQGLQADLRTSWTNSDHSEELSNETGGGAVYPRGSYPGLNGTQGASFTPAMALRGLNDLNYPYQRSHTAQHHDISMRGKDSPILRVSASMPQLKPGIIQHHSEEDLERSSSSVYSAAFPDFFSSSSESLHDSRCPSSSSSPASNSHSSGDGQDILATGISSATIKLVNWPADVTQENEQKHALGESEDPVYRHKEDIPRRDGDIDGDTPRPSSHHFNASEWINGDDYSHPSSDYQFPTPTTPERRAEQSVGAPNYPERL